MRRAPDAPPTEDADRVSATNSEVESAMNHRRRRTILCDACFSQGALDAFNSGDAHLRAAQNGLARAITADYPGLLPASQVTETKVPAL